MPPFFIGEIMVRPFYIFLILFLLFLKPELSFSFAYTAAEKSAPTFLRGGGAMTMRIPASATAHVPAYGRASKLSITRNMLADINPSSGILTFGSIALASFTAWVESHPADFPILYRLLHPELPLTSYPVGTVMTDIYGTKVKIVGSPYTISSSCTAGSNSGYPAYSSGVLRVGWFGGGSASCPGGSSYGLVAYPAIPTSDPVSPTPTKTLPLQDLENAIKTSPDGNLKPEYVPEIDKAISQNPDLVSTPSDLPDQLAKARESSDPANKDTDLDGVPDISDDDIDGDGAPNSEDSDADGNNVEDIEETPTEEETVDLTQQTVPDIKGIDFSPLRNLGESISGKFPFSLVSTVANLANSFLSSPKTPEFSIRFPSPFYYEWKINLSRWDSWAALFRFIIGATFLVLVSMNIMRRWV